jgi:hypothetical protein
MCSLFINKEFALVARQVSAEIVYTASKTLNYKANKHTKNSKLKAVTNNGVAWLSSTRVVICLLEVLVEKPQ